MQPVMIVDIQEPAQLTLIRTPAIRPAIMIVAILVLLLMAIGDMNTLTIPKKAVFNIVVIVMWNTQEFVTIMNMVIILV